MPWSNTANAVSCIARWRAAVGTCPEATPLQTFCGRFDHLCAAVDALSVLAAQNGWKMRFDPQVPQSAMVHVYLEGDVACLEARHDVVLKTTGYRLWNRLRGPGHTVAAGSGNEHYFEWSMGPRNSAISIDVFCEAWKAFFEDQ